MDNKLIIDTLKSVTASGSKVTIDLEKVADKLSEFYSYEEVDDAFNKMPPLNPKDWHEDIVNALDIESKLIEILLSRGPKK